MKVNFHFLKECNFACKYCFVKPITSFSTSLEYDQIIKNLSKVFNEINLVGGEPTHSPYYEDVLFSSNQHFNKISLVTNGFNILKDHKRYNVESFETIGVSIDFMDKENNSKIGRVTRNGESLDFNDYLKLKNICKDAKVKFKLNLMVSSLNWDKDFKKELKALNPDRLKVIAIMKMNEHNDESDLSVTNEQFEHFLKINNLTKSNKVIIEGPGAMLSAYYIVFGNGDMIDNTNQENKVIGNWLNDNPEELMNKININTKKYNERYKK